jgi:DNA repair photolyase
MHTKFIHGDSTRLFLNTELGCASACSYCYLPSEGLPINASVGETSRMSADDILALLETDRRVIKGENGTVFSIGCFSECWDSRNKKETIRLILGLLPRGNLIQIATKRQIRKEELSAVTASPSWNRQLHVYVSSASISKWEIFEKGTTPPNRRFRSFDVCKELGVRAYLYVKPVLPNVTVNDVFMFGAIMKQHQVAVVVGDQFEKNVIGDKSPISDKLTVIRHLDVDRIREILRNYGEVHSNSVDSFRDMRS